VPVTGSTLYRRLPDGTWAAEREDPSADDLSGASSAPAGPAQPGQADSVAPAPPAAPSPGRTVRLRRIRPLRVLLWAVVAYVVWLVGLMVYAAFALPQTDALSQNPIPDTDGTVWLLVGSDSRAELSAAERRELTTGSEEGKRTDTIMLVHMSLGQAPRLVSIPRDSWVTIPAHTATDGSEVGANSAKVNAAYAYGGAPLLTETVEYNTGLHVDHYMEIGMGGIVRLTNAVGGIEVCFDEAIDDEKSGLDVDAGCQELDGKDALAWVRMRYSDPTGDLGRMERQQQYIALMVDEILNWRTVVNPLRQLALVNALLGSVLVDDGSGPLDLGRFGLGLGRIATGGGEITSVPVDDSDHWENGQWVLKWDNAEADELWASMGGQASQASAARAAAES
jgi:LCP family protein required for cell wall assembly